MENKKVETKIVEEPKVPEKKDEWELMEVATATSPVLFNEATEERIPVQDASLAVIFLKILNKLSDIDKKL